MSKQWVSAKEKMPRITSISRGIKHPVLVMLRNGTMCVAVLEQNSEEESPKWYDCGSEHWNINEEVKYWMELPKAP